MKLSPEAIEAHRRSFELDIRYLVAHLRAYQKAQIEVVKETESETVPDALYMIDLAQEGFCLTIEKYIERERENIKGKRDWMDEVKNILNPYGDDEEMA